MTWDEIKAAVEQNGGVHTVQVRVLRDAAGAKKSGILVRGEISRTLAGMGLGHIPLELPSDQDDPVRLYKRGTKVGEFIETVLTPGVGNDGKLRDQFADGGVDYAAVIQKVRELVAE